MFHFRRLFRFRRGDIRDQIALFQRRGAVFQQRFHSPGSSRIHIRPKGAHGAAQGAGDLVRLVGELLRPGAADLNVILIERLSE